MSKKVDNSSGVYYATVRKSAKLPQVDDHRHNNNDDGQSINQWWLMSIIILITTTSPILLSRLWCATREKGWEETARTDNRFRSDDTNKQQKRSRLYISGIRWDQISQQKNASLWNPCLWSNFCLQLSPSTTPVRPPRRKRPESASYESASNSNIYSSNNNINSKGSNIYSSSNNINNRSSNLYSSSNNINNKSFESYSSNSRRDTGSLQRGEVIFRAVTTVQMIMMITTTTDDNYDYCEI